MTSIIMEIYLYYDIQIKRYFHYIAVSLHIRDIFQKFLLYLIASCIMSPPSTTVNDDNIENVKETALEIHHVGIRERESRGSQKLL